MINYINNNNFLEILQLEFNSLNSTLKIQENLNKQILILIKKSALSLDFNDSEEEYFSNSITKLSSILSKSKTNIFFVKNLLNQLENLQNYYNNMDNSQNSQDDLLTKITLYNKNFSQRNKKIFSNTITIEKALNTVDDINENDDISKNITDDINENDDISKNITDDINKNDGISKNITDDLTEDLSNYKENILIISDMQKKVLLPYKIKDLKNILFNQKEKYSSFNEIIDDIYTRTIDSYKHFAKSRFKESYNLVTKKAHKSKLKGFLLGTELFFNYNLHPAIISACNTLDELDIYLACLEDETLSDFNCFEIQYEYAPVIQKVASKI